MALKEEEGADAPTGKISSTRGWYEDRYQSLIVQRNLFFLLTALCIIFITISVVVLKGIVSQKRIEPMVIEVEDSSGIISLVNPNLNRDWTASKTINQYFLIKYLRARETYNAASYLYDYNTIVRLLSSSTVYRQFNETINNPSLSPISKYGANNTTELEIRSILFLKNPSGSGQTAQIRFTVTEKQGSKLKYNKILSIVWDYIEMHLNFDDMMINPLGFQVQFYTVTDDVNA